MKKAAATLSMSVIVCLITGFALTDICSAQEKKEMVVKKGNKIKVQYTGRLQDGTVFDQSKEKEPLEFIVGSGQLISGFDKAVEGMKLNEEKKVTLKTEEAYGQSNPDLIRQFERSFFPADFSPEKDIVIELQDANGRKIPGTIVDVTEENVSVDLNHPLAGKELIFDISVVDIEQNIEAATE